MSKDLHVIEAREVALNYSSNAGYDIEIGYFLHHKKKRTQWHLYISQMYGWVSKHQLCLKLDSVASSYGRGALSVSPLSESDTEILDEFSVYLNSKLRQAFGGTPTRRSRRQTIVFYIRVSLNGRELYYRKVYRFTFDNMNTLIDRVPNVKKALRESFLIETPNNN